MNMYIALVFAFFLTAFYGVVKERSWKGIGRLLIALLLALVALEAGKTAFSLMNAETFFGPVLSLCCGWAAALSGVFAVSLGMPNVLSPKLRDP